MNEFNLVAWIPVIAVMVQGAFSIFVNQRSKRVEKKTDQVIAQNVKQEKLITLLALDVNGTLKDMIQKQVDTAYAEGRASMEKEKNG